MMGLARSKSGQMKVGDDITEFPFYTRKLPASTGDQISLSQYKGQQPCVLFFFPKAHTSGCTKEVCEFRDKYAQFQDVGAQVLGISSDSVEELKNFAQAQNAPYPLLSDANGELRQELKIKGNLFGVVAGRETFVISKEGVVLLRFNDGLRFKQHVQEALNVLQKPSS